jgi:hypothetical protein
MPLTPRERLEEFYNRLGGQQPSATLDDALERIRRTLDEVEDLYSGITKKIPPPPRNQPDGRMYPPQDDSVARNPDGSLVAQTKGHTIDIGKDGTITIRKRSTGQVEFHQAGGGP